MIPTHPPPFWNSFSFDRFAESIRATLRHLTVKMTALYEQPYFETVFFFFFFWTTTPSIYRGQVSILLWRFKYPGSQIKIWEPIRLRTKVRRLRKNKKQKNRTTRRHVTTVVPISRKQILYGCLSLRHNNVLGQLCGKYPKCRRLACWCV